MFTVTLINEGTKFWLRGTTWAFHADRANTFETEAEARAALEKARQFMKASMFKRAIVTQA